MHVLGLSVYKYFHPSRCSITYGVRPTLNVLLILPRNIKNFEPYINIYRLLKCFTKINARRYIVIKWQNHQHEQKNTKDILFLSLKIGRQNRLSDDCWITYILNKWYSVGYVGP